MNPLEQIIQILQQFDELKQAKRLLDIFAKRATSLDQYDLLAKLYNDIKYYNDAFTYAKKALAVAPDNDTVYACRANIAKICNHLNEPEEALFYLNINDKITPNDPEVLLEKVFSLFLMNRKYESEQILRDMKKKIEDGVIPYEERLMNRINFNLGTYDLYAGKFKEGLTGFLLSGKKVGIWKELTLTLPFWSGGIQPGKSLLIMAEGGIGDEIMFVRFMKMITEYDMNPIWYTTRKDLAEVFNRNGFTTTSDFSSISKDTLWTYSMTLPLYLDVNERQLWNGPYLNALRNDVLPNNGKLKIAFKWAGSNLYDQDLHRSIEFQSLFDAIKDTPNAEFYSLQRDDGKEDSYHESQVNQIPELLETWESTLSVINSADVIITSCTSIVHAAGALGKRVIVLVPICKYFCWSSPDIDNKNIWYGENITVLEQVAHRSWTIPLTRLQQILHSL